MAAPATNMTTSIIPEVGIGKISPPAGLPQPITYPWGQRRAGLDLPHPRPTGSRIQEKPTYPTYQAHRSAGAGIGYCDNWLMMEMSGRNIEITMNPTTTPSKTIIIGSRAADRLASVVSTSAS